MGKWKLLESFRIDNGLTYKELAYMLNCSSSYIWQIINKKRRLTYDMAVELAKVFNTTSDDIFFSDYKKDKKSKLKLCLIDKRKQKMLKRGK